MRRKSNGFTIIEVLGVILIFAIIFGMTAIAIKKGGEATNDMVCVEWEDVQTTDCWSYGMGTSCEHYVEKRCVRYDVRDGEE